MKKILFIHGWPDTEKLWEKQIEYFKDSYHCHTVTLPGFGEEEEAHDFPELVQFIVDTIKTIGAPVILVGHDWGALLCYMVENKHPELVEKIVGLDVGTGGVRSKRHIPLAITYQLVLTGAWLMRKQLPVLSTRVTRGVAHFAGAPFKEDVHTRKNYIYYYFWRDLLIPKYRKNLLLTYKPKCPLLYIYSESKPIMFHSVGWEKSLKKRSDCAVHSVRGSGHWFMYKKPELANKVIADWLVK